MKILKLTAENVKKLSVVEITPGDKGLVIVAGKNGAGKSSVLDSIMYALGGKETMPSKPVRRGEDKAKIELDLGDYSVVRTITPTGGGSLTVRNKDNQRLDTPQTILDGLFGQLTFDPLEFKGQKPDKRSETLQALVGLDFSKQEAEIKRIFDERTAVNREVKAIEARAVAAKEYPSTPDVEVSTSEILEQQRKASETNSANATRRRSVSECRAKCERLEKEYSAVQDGIEALRTQIKQAETRQNQLYAVVEAAKIAACAAEKEEIPADVDLSQFEKRCQEVEQLNVMVRANKQKADLRKQWKEKSKVADSLTTKLEALEKEKRAAIQKARFPVDGLSLSDTREVEFNGIPFDEVNTADQLRVSVAMGLAMNPKLRVLLVRQGNDLDSDNLKLIGEMAQAADAQVWLERVSEEGDVAVIIEDGHVKETETATDQKELIK